MRRMPERDLWPGIESRLAARGRRGGWVPLALAAGVAALAVLTTSRLGPPATVAEPVAVRSALPLTADARAIIKAEISMTRGAEARLRQALRHDPDSRSLNVLLVNVEQRERALHAML
jgi:hypothetical protein